MVEHKMVKINCLECGKPLKFPSYVKPEDYDGQIQCHVCKALLYIRFKSSEVRKYKKVVEKQSKVSLHGHDVRIISAVPRPDYSNESKGKAKESK